MNKNAERLAPSQVPEVLDFMEAQDRLDEFKKKHADILVELDAIAEDYNQKLEAADKAVRARAATCGPFENYQTVTSYDAKALFELLGKEKFIQVGGKLGTETTYNVDKARIEASISKNLIPADVIERFKKESPRYHKPEKIILP